MSGIVVVKRFATTYNIKSRETAIFNDFLIFYAYDE